MYAMIDAQSNQSLAKSAFFDSFDIPSEETTYTMSTCAGYQRTAGRKLTGLYIESAAGDTKFPLPPVLECENLPGNRRQIATPEVASSIPHLRNIAHLFPPLDPEAEILLLLGVDAPDALASHTMIRGPRGTPIAHETELGWTISGMICADWQPTPTQVNVSATTIHSESTTSHLKPRQEHPKTSEDNPVLEATVPQSDKEHLKTSEDNPALEATVSQINDKDKDLAKPTDIQCLPQCIGKELKQETSGSWVAPLLIRMPSQRLFNNQKQVPYPPVKFMDEMTQNEHVELAPSLKKDKRLSLNKILLAGPDLPNNLLGRLTHFKREAIGLLKATRHVRIKLQLHVFSDASTQTIAAIAFTRVYGGEGNFQVLHLFRLDLILFHPLWNPLLAPDPVLVPVLALVTPFSLPALVPVVPVPMEPDTVLDPAVPVLVPAAPLPVPVPVEPDPVTCLIPGQRLLPTNSRPDRSLN